MKASLCKLSSSTVARVCDYHAKLFLIAISSTLKSLLRPAVLNTPDKSPGDRLTEICSKVTDVGRYVADSPDGFPARPLEGEASVLKEAVSSLCPRVCAEL